MEGAIKKNADAELAFNTAHSLILKLAQHKAKASPDPPQVSLFKLIDIYHLIGIWNLKLFPTKCLHFD